MAYFEVMLSGKGITLPIEGTTVSAIGFYVSRIVRAANQVEAQAVARDAVAAEWRGKRFASNRGSQPSLAVDSVSPISFVSGLLRGQPGYSFYSQEGAA